MKKYSFIVLGTAIALFCSCNSGHHEVLNNADTASMASSTDSTAVTEAKLVKTSALKFKVKDVQQSGEQITALTTRYQGVVMHHESHTDAMRSQDTRLSTDSLMRVTSQSLSAQMVVKVPAEHLEQFMDEVSKMGLYVNLREVNIEDKTFDYLSSKLKLQSRTQLINQQKSGKVVIKDPAAVMQLKDDMIDEKINAMLVNSEVKYSTATLSFYQSNIITREVIADDNPDAYQLPFFNQLGLAFANGWYLFKQFIIGIANLWACILALGLLWYAIRVYRRHQHKPLAVNG